MSCCGASRSEVSASGSGDEHLGKISLDYLLSLAETPGPRADSGAVVSLPCGIFWMGSEVEDVNLGDGEGLVREVLVEPFNIGRFVVTNWNFARFVRDTGYVTEAEELGWSFFFAAFLAGPLRARSP